MSISGINRAACPCQLSEIKGHCAAGRATNSTRCSLVIADLKLHFLFDSHL